MLDSEKLEARDQATCSSCYYRKYSPGFGHFRDSGIRSGIYFVVCEVVSRHRLLPIVKIGCTKDVRRRSHDRYVDNPADLYLVHFVPVFPATRKELQDKEKEFHCRFENYRVRGEWYDFEKVAKDMGWDWNTFITEE